MKDRTFLAVVFLVLIASATLAHASDPCLDCHGEKTPGIVEHWKRSAHFGKEVGCADCHGKDIEANHKRQVTVDAARCGECHKAALSEHRLSRHAIGLRTGQACTRNVEDAPEKTKSCVFCHKDGSLEPVVKTECAMFLSQSPEMQRQGCESCHKVEVRCDTCHTKHGTDLKLAGDPGTCGSCHMGPDHAQMEMWELSPHGVIYRQGGEGPTCAVCHMDGGSHNVSRGIATGLPREEGLWKKEREFMVGLCSRCHTQALARRNLGDSDRVEEQSRALVAEAQKIVEDLQKEGLLLPGPSERPPHPLLGQHFTVGPHMLYENLSSVESLFFRMRMFYYMSSFKGAFHQNPDYAHWYGNAPLKLALSEIKSEAAFLRKVDVLRQRIDNLGLAASPEGEAGDIRKQLRELLERRHKGELTEEEYEKAREEALKQKGL